MHVTIAVKCKHLSDRNPNGNIWKKRNQYIFEQMKSTTYLYRVFQTQKTLGCY